MAALGDCALGCNVLGMDDEIVGPVESLLPVAARIFGCPPPPHAIAAALLELLDSRAQAGVGSKRSFSVLGGTRVG